MKNKKTSKKKKNSNYKRAHNLFNKFEKIDLSTAEGRMQADNLPDSEKKDFIVYTLAVMADTIADNVAKNHEEKVAILDAVTKIEPAQVLSLLIVKSATNATTTKQVLNIIQNINSYCVTPFLKDYVDVGKEWTGFLAKVIPLEVLKTYTDADYAAVGRDLCFSGCATLTPYGVLWNTQGGC